jgi:uncharacterized protein
VPEVDHYAPGTPCWVDVVCGDIGEAVIFYEELFGWRLGPTEGGYGVFTLDGPGFTDAVVAGIGPAEPGQRAVWSTYVSVADIDATLSAAEQAGGTILQPATDVADAGRGGAFVDPTGATLSVWQPGAHIGARAAGVPGTRAWSELVTGDVAGAGRFYADVFGWRIATATVNNTQYAVAHVGEVGVAGIAVPPRSSGLSVHWSVTFAVADCDKAAEIVRSMGGRVTLGPTDVPDVGRFAAVAAPGGETFSVLAVPNPLIADLAVPEGPR